MQPDQIARYNRLLRALDSTSKEERKRKRKRDDGTIQSLLANTETRYKELRLQTLGDPSVTACQPSVTDCQPSSSVPSPKSNTETTRRVVQIQPPAQLLELKDLLAFVRAHPALPGVEYQCGSLQWQRLLDIEPPLAELCRMVGLQELKRTVLDQLLYFLQDLHKNPRPESNDYLHTVLAGPPGTGKTIVGKLLGQLYGKMGILSKGTFKKVVRSDLIAGYLGQTALKTKEVVKEALGGVLFIDEAYALGNVEKRDSFAKECIDTLCELASDHKDDLMIIVAGYEQELKDCFFAYNAGLETRFGWRFRTEEYTAEQLHQIFLKAVADAGWQVDESLLQASTWFHDFPNQGRDMEMLLTRSKIAYGRRMFLASPSATAASSKRLTMADVEAGRTALLRQREQSNAAETRKKHIWQSMYC